MKSSIVFAVLGLAVRVMSSFAQGSMKFNSYTSTSNSSEPAIYNVDGTTPLAAGWTADLAWTATAINDTAGNGALNAALTVASVVSPSVNVVATSFDPVHPGYFQGAKNFELNPYTTGTRIYFEVLAYETGYAYANSPIRGHSATFSTTLAVPPNIALTMPDFGSFHVSPVPEPTTLALAGLGLAGFVIYRGKKPEYNSETH
jgi:hypothetical protein